MKVYRQQIRTKRDLDHTLLRILGELALAPSGELV
jgi:hypothetical protein